MVITLQKVLISDEVDPKCVEVLKANGIEVVKNTKLTNDELLTEIPVSGQFVFSSSSLSHVSACPVGEMGNRPPHTGPHSLFYLFAHQCCLLLLCFISTTDVMRSKLAKIDFLFVWGLTELYC